MVLFLHCQTNYCNFITLLDGMLNHELNVELLLVFGMSIYMNKTEECLMNSTEEMCKGQH